ncbi:hypothetical protein B7494_g5870 [Chlorociboria aeruginascens]|nr:hypothetical protein B7494_g5870 [Chlorociboria aeruginascens]
MPEPVETVKRRQASSSPKPSPKRARLTLDSNAALTTEIKSQSAPEKAQPPPDRRKSAVQEERKRGQRLFGGLLSTLSQTTPNGQQKRRLEIEKRQQEKAKQQKMEDEVRRVEKAAELKDVRKAEQVKFDERSMRLRHSSMRAMAKFLCTKAEPKLYYKPWELRQFESEIIAAQTDKVEVTISREIAEFFTRFPKADNPADNEDGKIPKETLGEPHTESPSISNVQATINPTNPLPVQATQSDTLKTAEKDTLEENTGEMDLTPIRSPFGRHSAFQLTTSSKPEPIHRSIHLGTETRFKISTMTITLTPDKIHPTDPRITYKTFSFRDQTYSYIESLPTGTPSATIFLIHGFPDLSFGWRYQIPYLTSIGLRVIAPDMIGYGRTSAPASPTLYTYKHTADFIAALAAHVSSPTIILGGHDWGGMIVYRTAIYYPKLITALFGVCTPFFPPSPVFIPMTAIPSFKYQAQLAGPDVEAKIVGTEKIKQFLNALYGGKSADGKVGFDTVNGVLFDNLPLLQKSPLFTEEELNFYAEEYSRTGMHGPLNWYRTYELNWNEDKANILSQFPSPTPASASASPTTGAAPPTIKPEDKQFQMPTLFILGLKDAALPPQLSIGMETYFKDLERKEVNASHWVLVEKGAEVNGILGEWLADKIPGGERSSL